MAGRATLLFLLATTLGTLGATALIGGFYCYAQPDPGAGCAVLTVLVPLIAFPFAAALGIFAAAQSGWLARRAAATATADNESGSGGGDG